jgi:diguanylate cyclase (GGDEF)-like protein
LAIIKLVQRDDATPQQIVQLLKTDPALSGRILSFANSAAFGARRPVVSLQDAVVLVGMTAVRNFALSLSLVGKHATGACSGFDYDRYWSRALMLAVANAAVIAWERTIPPEEGFTLGLLTDIGRLALATAWPDKYGACLRETDEQALIALELSHFAIDHDTLSYLLMADWGLPAIFIDALKQCHQPTPDPTDTSRVARLARQLAFARRLCDYCLADDMYRTILLPALEKQARHFSIETGTLATLATSLLSQWQEWGKLIHINTDQRESSPELTASIEPDLLGLDILLVDDDPMMLKRLTKQLTDAGHRVGVCRDGHSALKNLVEQSFQLLLTDWRMAHMDGVELSRTIRASALGKSLYIIMLTATDNEEGLLEAFDAGIDDFVTKPVSIRVLLARIRAAQRIIALQQELQIERQEQERATAELAVVNRRLQQLANTDLLTKLPNRRYALNRLEQEWEAAKRHIRPLCVFMLDLDFFKLVNDTLGHDIGDQVLAHTAEVMRDTVRTNDVVCRLGGEEFLIITPNTDAAAALLLAERIRSAIETRQLNGAALPRPVTASIGVACSTSFPQGWQDLVKMADHAVFQVKKASRNAVKLAS